MSLSDPRILESFDNIRVAKMSSGATIIGRALESSEIERDTGVYPMDSVFQIVPLSKGAADYGLVPWIPGADVTQVHNLNYYNIDVILDPSDEFVDGWAEAMELYAKYQIEDMEEAEKMLKGQLSDDEIKELLDDFDKDPTVH